MEHFLLILNKLPTAILWMYSFVMTALTAFIYFKRSTAAADVATIDSLNRQLETQGHEMDAMNKRLKEFSENLITLTKQLGESAGIIATKNEQLQQYELIFQNRDPELLKLLTSLGVSLSDINNFMKSLDGRIGTMYRESQATNRAVKLELKVQTEILKKTDKRNTEIDKAHGQASRAI